MGNVPERWELSTPPEMDFRRPDFRGGIPVLLADGQEWSFAGPRELAEADANRRDDLTELLSEIAQAEDESDRLRGELALAIFLFSINYDLPPADYTRLLAHVPGKASGSAMQAGFRDLARRHAQVNCRRDAIPAVKHGRRFRLPAFRTVRRDPGSATRIEKAS
jgi:hypothetical protein